MRCFLHRLCTVPVALLISGGCSFAQKIVSYLEAAHQLNLVGGREVIQ